MKKVFDYIITGAGISFIITTMFMLYYIDGNTGKEVVNVYTIWLVFGITTGLLSFVYKLRINIYIKQLFHITILLITWYISMHYTFKILGLDIEIPINALILFLVIYILISLIYGYIEKKKLNKLNAKLNNE